MSGMYRALFTGSRTWEDEQTIRDAVASLVWLRGPENVTIVHGACLDGADNIVDRVAGDWGGGLTIERHPADWGGPCRSACRPGHRRRRWDGSTFCPAAGLYRDAEMVGLGADECLAFIAPCIDPRCRRRGSHGSHGASATARLAEKAGIPVRRFPEATGGRG